MPKKPPRATTWVAATSLLTGGACDNKSSAPKNPLPPAANNLDFGDMEDAAYENQRSYVVPSSGLLISQIQISAAAGVPESGEGVRSPDKVRLLEDQIALIKTSFREQDPESQKRVTSKLSEMREILSLRHSGEEATQKRCALLAEILAASGPPDNYEARKAAILSRLAQNPQDQQRARKWISDALDKIDMRLSQSVGR